MKKLYTFIVLAMFAMNVAQAQGGASCLDAVQENSTPTCVYSSYVINGTEMWLKFTAVSTNVSIEVYTIKWGTDAPHVHEIFLIGGTCANPQVIAQDDLPFISSAEKLGIELSAGGLIIGSTYYILLKREATGKTCDKSSCYPVANPAAFDICIEETDFFIPPDVNLEPASSSHIYYKNKGQVVDTDGNPRLDIKAYTISSAPAAYYFDNKLSYVYASIDTNPVTLDTLHRVDMTLYNGEMPTMKKAYRQEATQDYLNYFLGHVPTGITKVRGFQRIIYPEVYPNIDLHVFSNSKGYKYYFVVKPGGNAEAIVMDFKGQDYLNIDGNGGLNIVTSIGTLTFEKAHVYRVNQVGNPIPMFWQPDYVNSANGYVKFTNFGNVPPNQTLVIVMDEGHGLPTTVIDNLEWSTYYGGNGVNAGYAVENDQIGNIYVGGYSTGTNFPVNIGAYQTTVQVGDTRNGILMKFNSQRQRQWATYYGGGIADEIRSIDYSTINGRLYVTGYTFSADFPIFNQVGAYNDAIQNGNADIFIASFDISNGFPVWSTFLGSNGDNRGFRIMNDLNGNKFLIGYTSNTFPIQPLAGAYLQSIYGGGFADGYIAKFDAQDQLIWSTYYGGSSTDYPMAGYVDGNGNLFVWGWTNSTNLELQDAGGGAYFQNAIAGDFDCFILKFDQAGVRQWATFVGGSAQDMAAENDGIVVTNNGIYCTGTTYSSDFPTQQFAGGFFDNTFGGGFRDAFVVGFDNNLNLIWSTYLGGADIEQGQGITSDLDGNIYTTGTSKSNDYPLVNLTNAYFQTYAGSNDVFTGDVYLSAFATPNLQMSWSTMIGGNAVGAGGEIGFGINVFMNSKLFITGGGQSDNPNYPVVDPGNGAWFQPIYNGLVNIIISELNLIGVTIGLEEVQDGFAEVSVYPNPTNGKIWIESMDNDILIEVYGVLGNIIEKMEINRGLMRSVNTESWSNGVYLLKIYDENGRAAVYKIVRQ